MRAREHLGIVLQQRRAEAGLSQEEMAARTGFHRTYLSLLERGLKNPSLPALLRLAAGYNLTAAELLGRVEARVAADPAFIAEDPQPPRPPVRER